MDSMPAEADFGVYIDFSKGDHDPKAILGAAHDIIGALDKANQLLAQSLDASVEPVLLLEDIEAGSSLIWLRDAITQVDDQAVKELDWKQQIGKYLVRGKYLIVDFLNKKIEADDTKRIEQLSADLLKLAQETDIKYMHTYTPAPIAQLATTLSELSRARARLPSGDRVKYLSREPDLEMLESADDQLQVIEELAIARRIPIASQEMILLVRRPDYIGNSQWEFRHGRSPLSANIADDKWLSSFQGRNIDVRPGDAIQCIVSGEARYGHNGELLSQSMVVDRVLNVIENRASQPGLL